MEAFWEAKIFDFRTLFDVFSKSFLKHAREEQKIDPRGPKKVDGFLGLDSGGPQATGERKREGIKSLGLHNELGLSDSRSVIELGNQILAMGLCVQHAAHHLRWAAD